MRKVGAPKPTSCLGCQRLNPSKPRKNLSKRLTECLGALQPTDESPTRDAFERCLTLAFEVIRSYRLSQRVMTRYPTVERLPFVIAYMVRTLTQPMQWEGPFTYLLHYNSPSSHEFAMPGPKEMDKLGVFFEAVRQGNPMITYSDQAMEARIALKRDGDYSNAVTHAQTALEALFDNLLTLMLWEEGVDPTQAAKRTVCVRDDPSPSRSKELPLSTRGKLESKRAWTYWQMALSRG